jgi:hypothetical protein
MNIATLFKTGETSRTSTKALYALYSKTRNFNISIDDGRVHLVALDTSNKKRAL